jgi:WD40 repeat protein
MKQWWCLLSLVCALAYPMGDTKIITVTDINKNFLAHMPYGILKTSTVFNDLLSSLRELENDTFVLPLGNAWYNNTAHNFSLIKSYLNIEKTLQNQKKLDPQKKETIFYLTSFLEAQPINELCQLLVAALHLGVKKTGKITCKVLARKLAETSAQDNCLKNGSYNLLLSPDASKLIAKTIKKNGSWRQNGSDYWQLQSHLQNNTLKRYQMYNPQKVISFNFTPDSKNLLVESGGGISCHDLATGLFISNFSDVPDEWDKSDSQLLETIRTITHINSQIKNLIMTELPVLIPDILHVFQWHHKLVVNENVSYCALLKSCSIDIFSVSEGKKVKELAVCKGQYRYQYSYLSGCFNNDSTLFAAGCSRNTIYIWDLNTQAPVCNTLANYSIVTLLCFNPQSTLLAAAASCGALALFNPQDGSCIAQWIGFSTPCLPGVYPIAFSPDGMLLAHANDNIITILNVANPKVQKSFENLNLERTLLFEYIRKCKMDTWTCGSKTISPLLVDSKYKEGMYEIYKNLPHDLKDLALQSGAIKTWAGTAQKISIAAFSISAFAACCSYWLLRYR